MAILIGISTLKKSKLTCTASIRTSRSVLSRWLVMAYPRRLLGGKKDRVDVFPQGLRPGTHGTSGEGRILCGGKHLIVCAERLVRACDGPHGAGQAGLAHGFRRQLAPGGLARVRHMVQSGARRLTSWSVAWCQILRVRRRTDLIVDDLHGPFGLGPPEEAFQEAVPIGPNSQPVRMMQMLSALSSSRPAHRQAALAARGDRTALSSLGVRGVPRPLKPDPSCSGRGIWTCLLTSPRKAGRRGSREGFLWLFFSRVFRVPAYGIENDVRVDEFDARLEFYGIQEIAVFKIQRLRLPPPSCCARRPRGAVSAKNESDRSTSRVFSINVYQGYQPR